MNNQTEPARKDEPPEAEDELATALAKMDDEGVVVRNDQGVVAELNRSELETQLDAAHRYARSIKKFLNRAMGMATLTRAIAESCIYSLPRGGKPITGPSVRLAEICAATYGNLHVGARPMEVGRDHVISQGIAWDLETNYRITIEAKRRILDKNSRRFNDDMIGVTHAAATAIAFRNAVFKVIPRAYIDQVYAKVRQVAVGDAKTLDSRRAELFDRLAKMGVVAERVLSAVGKDSIADVGLDEIEHLIGLGTSIHNGDRSVDDAFPPIQQPMPAPAEGQQGRRMSLGKGKSGAAEKAEVKPGDKPGDNPERDPEPAG